MSMQHRIQIPTTYTKNYWTGKDEWPAATPTQDQINIYKNWCKTNVGANRWNYYGQYRLRPFEFRFKKPEDLLAFKLTFGLHNENTVAQ